MSDIYRFHILEHLPLGILTSLVILTYCLLEMPDLQTSINRSKSASKFGIRNENDPSNVQLQKEA